MSQGSILTDMFANSSASISALLAQMQNALGGGLSEGNNFSSLLSDSSATPPANVSATLSTQTDAATPATVTVDTTSAVSTTSSSAASELKNMQDLSTILHRAMNLLRQQDHKESNHKTKATSASKTASDGSQTTAQQVKISTDASQSITVDAKNTRNTSSSNTTPASATQTSIDPSSVTNSANDAATNDGASSPDTMDVQTIEKLLSELMLLTQTVIKNLQQAQSATGTVQNVAATSTDTKIASDLQDLLALLTGSSSEDSSSTDLAAQISSSPDAFQKLLSVLQKAAKQFTPDDTNTAQGNANKTAITTSSDLTASDAASLTADANISDLTAQLVSITARIKDDFSTAQKQGMDSTSVQMASTTIAPPTGLAAMTAAAKSTAATTSATATQNAALALNGNTSQSQGASDDATSTQPLTPAMAFRAFENTSAETENESSMHGGSGTTNGFDNSMMLSNEASSAPGTTNFADHLTSMRMISTTVMQQPSPVDQAILQISRGLKNGNDQMSLQLHPADLGKITVKLDFSNDGKVQGTVTADNPKTLELLQKDSRSLERALQDAGLRADPGSLSFNLGNPSGQDSGQTAAGKNSFSGTTNPDGTISADEDIGLVNGMANAETYYITPTGVNIRV